MSIQYVGNKQKHAEELLNVILRDATPGQVYVEPFVGSAAVICQVPSHFIRIGADKNPYVIALHEAVRDGWIPPSEVSEAEYMAIKRSPSAFPKHLVGFVSIGCSFGGKMWGGYARGSYNYAATASRGLLKGVAKLQGIEFRVASYVQLAVPDGSIVYCDPPYENTTEYEYSIKDFATFWNWCDELIARQCKVFVSGYSKPLLWEVAWEKSVKTCIDAKKQSARTEKLFVKSFGSVRETSGC